MPSSEVLDFAKLLAPIPGEKPAGVDLRADTSPVSDYYTIRDARKAASDAERRIDKGDESAEPPIWHPVLERATRVLAEKTKDLEVTAYLIESLARLRGFPGIRDGYRLARELVEQFWDGLHPVSVGGEIQERFSHILYLNGLEGPGTLIVPVRKIALTAATSVGTFNLTHHQQARSLAQLADAKLRQKRIDEGAITFEKIQKAVAETPAKFYTELVEDIAQSAEEFRRFCVSLSERAGFDVPSSDLVGVLEAYLDVVKDLARDKLQKPPAPAPIPATGAAQPGSETQAPLGANAAVIKNRDDALERLRKVADYFREHEPQSIIPYALEQVATWGKMSLPELLSELIPEEGPRKNVFKQVGIKPPEAKK
jgi:type VI secretion system protein ImpA